MEYRILTEESVQQALQRIAREQLDAALADIDAAATDAAVATHEVRKRCKKLRALLRLVRPALDSTYREENAWFRDTARALSGLRDRHMMARTLDGLTAHAPDSQTGTRFGSLRARLLMRTGGDGRDREQALAELRRLRPAITLARRRVSGWSLSVDGFAAIEAGLRRTYRRGHRALPAVVRDAAPTAVHEYRKAAKYHWYHARLLAGCWGPVMYAWSDEAHLLSEQLGEAHDLAVLRRALVDAGAAPGSGADLRELLGRLDHRYGELVGQAVGRGRRLYAERPRALTARMGGYWDAWHCGQRLPQARHSLTAQSSTAPNTRSDSR